MADPVGGGQAARTVICTTDPQRLLDEWAQRRRVLEDLVPQLPAVHATGGAAPRSAISKGPATTFGFGKGVYGRTRWGVEHG